MKAGKKKIAEYIVTLTAGPLVGLFALILVFLLPTEPMREHLYWSLDMIEKEFTDELLIDGFTSTLTGNFTDCLMLEQAVYAGGAHSVVDRALHIYRAESYYDESNPEGWQPGRSLMDYMAGIPQPREVEYGRYWHGYLVFLKPLLLVTSFNSIRLFFSGLQLFLVGGCVILMTRRGESGLAGAFLVSLPFLYYVSTYASLSQSVCLFGMLAAMIALFMLDDKLTAGNTYGFYFLIVGMLTSYFDLLTYPLITLGFPLGIWLYLHGGVLRHDLRKMLLFSGEWGCGYLWMWGAKWILVDVFTGSNIVGEAFRTVSERTGNAAGYGRVHGFLHVVSLNLSPFLNWGFILLGVFLMFFALLALVCKRKWVAAKQPMANMVKKQFAGWYVGVIPFVCLALYPFVWWFLTQNHSEEHNIFTCRIFAVTVFACAAAISKIFSSDFRATH